MSYFIIKCHNELNMRLQTLLTFKNRFPCVLVSIPRLTLCPVFLSPSSLKDNCPSPWTQASECLWIFYWNLDLVSKTSLETYWPTQIWNLKQIFWVVLCGCHLFRKRCNKLRKYCCHHLALSGIRNNYNSQVHWSFTFSCYEEKYWNYMLKWISQISLISYILHHSITKRDRDYYKIRELFYITKFVKGFITKLASFITKDDNYYRAWQFYYKMWQSLQNTTFITKCVSTKVLPILIKSFSTHNQVEFLVNRKAATSSVKIIV